MGRRPSGPAELPPAKAWGCWLMGGVASGWSRRRCGWRRSRVTMRTWTWPCASATPEGDTVPGARGVCPASASSIRSTGRSGLNYAHPTEGWTVDVVIDALGCPTSSTCAAGWSRGNRPRPGRSAAHQAPRSGRSTEGPGRHHLPAGGYGLLADAGGDGETIDREPRSCTIPATDWGLCHTLERNLRKVATFAREREPAERPVRPGCAGGGAASPPSAAAERQSAGRCAGGSGSGCAGTRPPKRSAS